MKLQAVIGKLAPWARAGVQPVVAGRDGTRPDVLDGGQDETQEIECRADSFVHMSVGLQGPC